MMWTEFRQKTRFLSDLILRHPRSNSLEKLWRMFAFVNAEVPLNVGKRMPISDSLAKPAKPVACRKVRMLVSTRFIQK